MSDIIDLIDAATGCQQCEGPLGDSASDFFCGETCQERWQADRVRAQNIRTVDTGQVWRQANGAWEIIGHIDANGVDFDMQDCWRPSCRPPASVSIDFQVTYVHPDILRLLTPSQENR